MSAPTIVIAYRGLGESPLEETILRQTGAQVAYVDTLDAPEVRRADALLVTTQPVTASVVGALERCKIISRVGVGLDNIDLLAATARHLGDECPRLCDRRGLDACHRPDARADAPDHHLRSGDQGGPLGR